MSRGHPNKQENQPTPPDMSEITPELLLRAYASGVFPMAEDRESSDLYWVDPQERGVIPLEGFHLPKRLIKSIRQGVFRITRDLAFADVMRACAAPGNDRGRTWINAEIIAAYTRLHEMGHAHSIECWQDEKLVGGLYGVAIGAAFFGESMFHRERDASKVALAALVARLKAGGYRLLDIQFITDHLRQFGAIEIPRADYLTRLARAIDRQADFYSLAEDAPVEDLLQAITQTS